MRPDTTSPDPPASLRRMLPGLALLGAGAAMLVIARGQPAWAQGQVGPGLLAQLLGAGVAALGAFWAALCARSAAQPLAAHGATGCSPSTTAGTATALPFSGPALLGAVLAFALAVPLAGLVVAAGLAAALAAWGAGERRPLALALTVAGLMTLVAGVGLILLPPTAPLWPRL